MPQEDFLTDQELFDRVRIGEAAAFEVLHERYADPAYRLAQSIVNDRGRAEDVVQEAFLSIWSARLQYRADRASFRTWALAIVRNRAIDFQRSLASRPTLALGPWEQQATGRLTSPSIDDEALDRLEGAELRESLTALPSRQAEAISLAFLADMTHPEVAARLAVPAGTVKSRIRLGLERLRGEMKPPA